MNFLPTFTAWQFALAGAICAAAPIIIHLLNRRRYRVVQWAAMPFLREALQRNRKMMQMRDILLLILRTAAVLLFGLALARPFFASGTEEFDRSKPLHAIVVLDNSLSMSYTQVDGTLLDKAKDRARTFIDELPEGSLVTLIPLCGTEKSISSDPRSNKDKSLATDLEAIEVVDRSASLRRAVNEARKAQEDSPDLSKRVVFISDQQRSNWNDLADAEQLKQLGPIQVVDVGPTEWENTWISDLRVQDGLADTQTPTTFVGVIEHASNVPGVRKDVQVSFYVDGELIAPKAITFDSQIGRQEVTFEHTFSTLSPSEGQPEFVPIKVELSADNLAADNERHLVLPVVASVPVVFIDQVRDDEEDFVTREGYTSLVRRLLAPTSGRDEMKRQLIDVRHLTIDELSQGDLEDARLVVIAGIRDPGSESNVALLRDYVRQGGKLVIAAGGDFQPEAWNEMAWLDGAGILPAPLTGESIGKLPNEEVSELNPVFVSVKSFADHYYFQLPGFNTKDELDKKLEDVFSSALFFKYAEVDADPAVIERFRETEIDRLRAEFKALDEAQQQRAALEPKNKSGELDEAGRLELAASEQRLNELRPAWLRWKQAKPLEEFPAEEEARLQRLAVLANQSLPQVRARFEAERSPVYLVERRIGEGNVLFVASSLSSDWTRLPKTNAFYIFDRILRSMIQETLPERNYEQVENIKLALPSDDRDLEITLRRPGREDDPEPISSTFIDREQRGVEVQKPLARGVYHVTALRPSISSDAKAATETAWDLVFAVNGDGDESNLDTLSRDAFEERGAESEIRWVGAGESISLAGAQISGQNSWKWMILLVLMFLLAELAILAWPMVKARLDESAPTAATSSSAAAPTN
jgi:hypothetical protein